MIRKIVTFFGAASLLIVALSSCGGGPLATAVSSKMIVDADIATGTDAATNKCTGYTISPDDVAVTINTLVQPTATKIVIDGVTIEYRPNGAAPSLPNALAAAQAEIASGSTGTVTVRVASQELKALFSSLVCTGTIYTYYAVLTFSAHDFYSGNSVNVEPATLNIRFADFAGK